jgi:ribonuclease P/MRP protein subunit POP5
MKPLPPTLRENRRYILIRVESSSLPSQKEIYYAIADAAASLFGDAGSSLMRPAVVWSEGEYAVVRCTRGFEQQLIAAAAVVTKCSGMPAVFRTIRTSGTIRGVRKGASSVPCSED